LDTLGVVEGLAVLDVLALVLGVAGDAVSTLRAWRAIALRRDPERREGFLGVYGPLSLLGLLVFWVVLLVGGWGIVWWGLRQSVSGVGGYLDAVYFAGVGFFTVGFGDLLPIGGLTRMLVLVEAFMGLVTMALVIGYLPTLYSAYARRELQLLALDDLSDEPTTPVSFLEASYANGGVQGVAAAFADWERWCRRAGGRRRGSRRRRGLVPGRLPAPGTARAPRAAVRAGLGPVPPASRHLLPQAGRGHRAAAGADGVPAPDGTLRPQRPRGPVTDSVPSSQRQRASGPWRWTPPTQRSMPLRATWSASPASTLPPAAVGRSRVPAPTSPPAGSSSSSGTRAVASRATIRKKNRSAR
jgi:hypothetical protein